VAVRRVPVLEAHYFRLSIPRPIPSILHINLHLLTPLQKSRPQIDPTPRTLAAGWICLHPPVLTLLVVNMWQCEGVDEQRLLVADMTQKCWTGACLRYALTVTVSDDGIVFV